MSDSIFEGCFICFTGSVSLGTRKDAQALVVKRGAEVTSTVTKRTTHLVLSKETFNSNTSAVSKAVDNGIHLVNEGNYIFFVHKKTEMYTHSVIQNIEWILDSIKEGKKKDESSYSHKQTANDSGNGSSVSKKGKDSERDKDEEEEEEPPKKTAKPNIVKVITKGKYPVAPESDHTDGEIYIDEQGNAYTVMLNQTNIGFNNNKFYQIQLIKTRNGAYLVFQRWGRVGTKGQSKKVCFYLFNFIR